MVRLTVLLLLALPATAGASPRALGEADDVARSGASAVLTRSTDKTITVTAAPLDGGARRTLLSVPVPAKRFVTVTTVASDQRVATLVTTEKGATRDSAQLYVGTADTALAPVADTSDVVAVDAAGDSIIASTDDKTFALAPDGSRRAFTLGGVVSQVHYAGDLVAFGSSKSDEELEELPPKTIVIQNWRTGELVRRIDLPERVNDFDLRPDGAIVASLEDRKLAEALPGADLRRLDAGAGDVAWAGDRIVVGRQQVEKGTRELVSTRTSVIETDGSQHRLGLEARFIDQLSGSSEDVLSVNSGCAMITPISDGPADSYTGSACTRSDAYIANSPTMPLRRSFSVPIRCLHAREGQPCTGRIRGGRVEPQTYRVPVGTTRNVRVRLTAKAWRPVRERKKALVHLSAPSDSYVLLRRSR